MDLLTRINDHRELPKEINPGDIIYSLNISLNDCMIGYTNITNMYVDDLMKRQVNHLDIISLDKALFRNLHITGFLLNLFKISEIHLNIYINSMLELKGYNRNEEPYEMNLYLLAQLLLNQDMNLGYYKYVYKEQREIFISHAYLNGFIARCQITNFHLIQAMRFYKKNSIEAAQASIVETFINAYTLIIQVGTDPLEIITKHENSKIFQ